MIGSLLFYALYPLSRFLTAARRSEASQKGVPPAVVHGPTQWDGGAVTTRRFTDSQAKLPDQKLSASSAAKGEAKERMNEISPEKEDNSGIRKNNKQPVAVLRDEPQNDAERQQEKTEVPMQQDISEDMMQNTENTTDISSTDVHPDQAVGELFKCLQTDDTIEETLCVGLQQTHMTALEDVAIPPEDKNQETTCPTQQHIQTPSTEEPLTTAVGAMAECWDEYCLAPTTDEQHDGADSSKLVFASQLPNTQTQLTLDELHNKETELHFPAGPGLAEEVKCPLWQFPAGSYYPSLEASEPFEVVWRLWQSAPAEEPALIPFPFTKTSMDFTVMSYNILAQDLLEAHEELYIHCPLEVLDWTYRCNLLIEEIHKWSPDILCLQEVQENHYKEHLYPALCQMGYTCVYKCRTGNKTDGCATCYKGCRFSEVSVSPLEFFRSETELLNRHNVGIVLLLRPVADQASDPEAAGPLLCVGNTHLLFNPRRGDVKLAQLAMVLAEIDRAVKSCKAKGEHCNIVLCGDFNSVPHMPLYQLITTGKLFYHGLPAWAISGQEDLSYKTHWHRLFSPLWPSSLGITDNCQYASGKVSIENQCQNSGKRQYSHDFMQQLRFCPVACVRPVDMKLIKGVTDITPDPSRGHQLYNTSFRQTLYHPLDLASVYKHILPGSGMPEVTTLHSEGGATVDYIFYSPRRFSTSDQKGGGNFVTEGLALMGSLSLLSEDVLWSMKGLPNYMFPSDHLCLVAKFQMDLNTA